MRLRVAVLFGGRSAEHEISCLSARSIIGALDPERYEVLPVGITKEGAWRLLPDGPPQAPEAGAPLPAVSPEAGTEVALDQRPGSRALRTADGERVPVDVVFPVLHGPFGEDGTIQGFLEMVDLPYVGSGVLASAVGMDKAVQKTLFRAAGLPVVEHRAVHERRWRTDPAGVEAEAAALGFPLFAKPAALGSSVGVSKVHGPGELASAIEEALRYGRVALLERAVVGPREIECAVLGNDEPEASVPGEIVPRGHEFYSYEAKYLDEGGSELLVPAPLDAATAAEVRRLSVLAFGAIQAAGMARVDFLLGADGALFVNEINTIPGFTRISMYPRLWEASGVPYPRLVDRLVELALERHEAERRRATTR
jgi:D-alanine-D-alanine ligase